MKKCTKCKKIKDRLEFYKNMIYSDGFCCWCKKCKKKYDKELHKKYPERFKEYSRKNRIAHPELYNRNLMSVEKLKKLREADKNYQQRKREENPEKKAQEQSDYRQKYPERIKANSILNYAIKKGEIKRLPCEIKGCKRKDTHGHHEDYSKPLEVIWLCPADHKKWEIGTIGPKDLSTVE